MELTNILVPVLVFISVMLIGAAILSARSASKQAVRKRLRDLEEHFEPADVSSKPKSRLWAALGEIGRLFSLGAPSASLREELTRAGYHGQSAPATYLGAKQAFLVLGLVLGTAAVLQLNMSWQLKVTGVLAAGVTMHFLPNACLQARRRRRTREVRYHLPDAVDLLEICVASGMGLDMGWNSVGHEIRRVSGILADEMALTNLELNLGAPRAAAMRHMAERTRVEELTSLVAMLVQSDRFGTSISDTLKAFAQAMREERSQLAQESAEKMAVKLLFPMVLFIFPAVLIVMVGPAAIRLFEAMTTQ